MAPLTARGHRSHDQIGAESQIVIDGGLPRMLTPIERERLQGLPDDWTRYRSDGEELADTPRYRMIGNGAVVPHVEWIGRRIAAALRENG